MVAVLSAVGWSAVPASAAGLDLHSGSQGPKVRTLEGRLQQLQLLSRSQVDRRYRSPTVRAVRAFQRQLHLRVTGTVNQRTWDLVASEVRRRAAPAPRPPTPTPAPTATPARTPAPLILGHRGARVPGITENTLASMQYAADKADVLEFDLQLTSDGQFVLMHDSTLDRTTNCAGDVATYTLARLQAECTTDLSGPVPTFAEIAAYAAGAGKAIAPELKDNTVTDEELGRFVAVIRDNGLAARAFVQSFSPEVFPRLRALDSVLTFVYLASSAVQPDAVSAAGASIAGLTVTGLTASTVAAFRAAGLRVWAWTVTAATSGLHKSLWDMGVAGVFTDVPGEARAVYHPA